MEGGNKGGNDPRMQLKKQNITNAPRLDSRRSWSLNVFSCFFNRLFNELFIQLWGSFPFFITIYGKHFFFVIHRKTRRFRFSFFLYWQLNFVCTCLKILGWREEPCQTHFTVIIIIIIIIFIFFIYLFLLNRVYPRVYLRCSLHVE